MNYPSLEQCLCSYENLLNRIDAIDPISYGLTRNYLDGHVTWLSPFITHGIIDTTLVAQRLLLKHSAVDCRKLLFELAWREYFHRVWEQYGDRIFSDMRPQAGVGENEVFHDSPPTQLLEAKTGIAVLDVNIQHLLDNGLMHNHARMWTASVACNIANTSWLAPAKWLHYHLLDGDLASNSLSWQWVAGAFSNKRYIANQENINKFSKHKQQGTFLDVDYETLALIDVPDVLQDRSDPVYDLSTPAVALSVNDNANSVAVRTLWDLDHTWQPNVDQQILFVDIDQYQQWPMSQKRWEFILHWAKSIPNLDIMSGTISDLNKVTMGKTVYSRDYPTMAHKIPATDNRKWLYACPTKPYKSFFAFWKQVCGDVGLKS